MNKIKIKRATRVQKTIVFVDKDKNIITAYNGKSAKLTIKNLEDNLRDDSEAVFEQEAIIDNGFPWDMSIEQTDIDYKEYKADIRITIEEDNRINTDRFYIEITDKVTEE